MRIAILFTLIFSGYMTTGCAKSHFLMGEQDQVTDGWSTHEYPKSGLQLKLFNWYGGNLHADDPNVMVKAGFKGYVTNNGDHPVRFRLEEIHLKDQGGKSYKANLRIGASWIGAIRSGVARGRGFGAHPGGRTGIEFYFAFPSTFETGEIHFGRVETSTDGKKSMELPPIKIKEPPM